MTTRKSTGCLAQGPQRLGLDHGVEYTVLPNAPKLGEHSVEQEWRLADKIFALNFCDALLTGD